MMLNKSKCILFFNGWGMDQHVISHLNTADYQLYELHAYHTLAFDFNQLKEYQECYLIAWSMGVWAANFFLNQKNIKFTKSIAINGTGKPVNDTYGIPEKIFTGTLNNWNKTNRDKFNKRISVGMKKEELEKYFNQLTTEDQITELAFIHSNHQKTESTVVWNKAVIGEKDFIFSPTNQWAYWHQKAQTILLPEPHFIFNKFSSWQEIIEL